MTMAAVNNGGIYKIRNKLNNKIYIGSAINFKTRWSKHKHDLKNNKHDNSYLQNSWNKHGEENFEFEIMETIKKELKHLLLPIEQWYFDMFTPYKRSIGYNICPTAGNSLGYKHTEKTIRLLKEKFGGHHLKGKNFTKEHCKNISEGLKGIKKSEEHTQKMINSLKNNINTSKIRKPVLQYDLNNNFIREYKSIKEAEAEMNNRKNIGAVCRNKRKTAGGYKWKFNKNNDDGCD